MYTAETQAILNLDTPVLIFCISISQIQNSFRGFYTTCRFKQTFWRYVVPQVFMMTHIQ
jgi:hypothetical protein